MTDQEIRQTIRSFFSKSLLRSEIPDDLDIFRAGLVSSLAAMQLVHFIQRDFGIKVEDEDLDVKNFCTIQAIAAFVQRKMR